jgi:hypothetical protein
MLVEMGGASKELVAVKHSLEITDESDKKSEVDNYHNRYKHNRCTYAIQKKEIKNVHG